MRSVKGRNHMCLITSTFAGAFRASLGGWRHLAVGRHQSCILKTGNLLFLLLGDCLPLILIRCALLEQVIEISAADPQYFRCTNLVPADMGEYALCMQTRELVHR